MTIGSSLKNLYTRKFNRPVIEIAKMPDGCKDSYLGLLFVPMILVTVLVEKIFISFVYRFKAKTVYFLSGGGLKR